MVFAPRRAPASDPRKPTLNTTNSERRHKLPDSLLRAADQVASEIAKVSSDNDLPGIGEGFRYQLESGGKRLRPAMVLWFLEELGGRAVDGVSFSLAVELLHNFFLIHDDIEDGDEVRRDRPTLWVRVGVPDAINIGDFMLADAYSWIGRCPNAARADLFDVFTTTLKTTVEGQALDLMGRADAEFTLERYEEVIRKKTGRYLTLGLVGAALLAGHPRKRAEQLWRVGDQLGPAFQMRDDIIDLTHGKGRGGQIGCDIREGKPSFLFAWTVEHGNLSDQDRERLIAVMGADRNDSTQQDVEWVIDLYRATGALAYCEQECLRRGELAIEEFRRIGFVPESTVDPFREIAEFIVKREA